MRHPYKRAPERDPNLENYPEMDSRISGLGEGQRPGKKGGEPLLRALPVFLGSVPVALSLPWPLPAFPVLLLSCCVAAYTRSLPIVSIAVPSWGYLLGS